MPKLSLNASKKTKHTPAGEIPVDWGAAVLSDIIENLESGVSVSGEDRPANANESGVLRVSAVSKGRFFPKENTAILPADLKRARMRPRAGAILVSRSNTPDLVGESARVPASFPNLFLPDKLWQVCLRPEAPTDEGWLSYVLQFPDVRRLISERASGTSKSMRNISKPSFLSIPIPLPPLSEQRRIADILSTWDRAIETLESLIAAKERRKQALMEQLLSGRKRLPGFTGKWPTTHLGTLAENVSVRNNGKLGWDRLYAVTKANGMIPMREQVMGISTNNCKLVRRDDFAYNPMRLNIGSLARWQDDEDVMVSGDYIVFRCNEGELDPRYFDHLRRSEHWNQFVNVGGSGSVRVRLYFKDIAPFQIRCPSFKEQQAIAAVLDTADRELTLHRQHLATLRIQKRGLMTKLLSFTTCQAAGNFHNPFQQARHASPWKRTLAGIFLLRPLESAQGNNRNRLYQPLP